MIQAAIRDDVTAVSYGQLETDENGKAYRILAICTKHDEEIEIRPQHLSVIGDAKRVTDFI